MLLLRFLISAALLCSFPGIYGQEVEPVFPRWNYFTDANTSLYKYFADLAFKKLDQRKQLISRCNSKKDWLQRQRKARLDYNSILGSFPNKTPLNTVVTGVAEQDGISVEKLYFESLPGYFVTAALFLPAGPRKKLPAIVYCSGHSRSGFRSRGYQHVILNLVKKGFAVLAFDPVGQGERRQFVSNEKRKSFSPTQEHSYPGSQLFLTGRAPAYYFIWDGIRAIDYLCSRPEIDTTRIGVTGRSGGGTQTAYLAAFDNRVAAAAPECYITSYEKLLMSRGPQDAEQNFHNSISSGLDRADLLICHAPKPMLIISTTRDIFSIQGARDVFSEVKSCYSYLGEPENIAMVEDDAGHASTRNNRQALYSFFQRHLANPGRAIDETIVPFKDKELTVTSGGSLYDSLKGYNLQSLAKTYLSEIIERKRPITGLHDLKARINSVVNPGKLPTSIDAVFSGRYWRSGYHIETYLLRGVAGQLPVYWLKPDSTPENNKMILLLDDRGKYEAVKSGSIADSLALEGYEVVVPDLSGFGELANGYINGGDSYVDKVPLNLWYTGLLIKQSLLSVRIKELFILLDWMKQRNKKIEGIALSSLTVDILHVAIMRNGDFHSVICIDPLISYQSVIEQPDYRADYIMSAVPGMVAQYDIYDLINFIPPTQSVLLINPRDGSGKIVNLQDNGHGTHSTPQARTNVNFEYIDTSFNRITNWLSATPY